MRGWLFLSIMLVGSLAVSIPVNAQENQEALAISPKLVNATITSISSIPGAAEAFPVDKPTNSTPDKPVSRPLQEIFRTSEKSGLSVCELMRVMNTSRVYDFKTKKWMEYPRFNVSHRIALLTSWEKEANKLGRKLTRCGLIEAKN